MCSKLGLTVSWVQECQKKLKAEERSFTFDNKELLDKSKKVHFSTTGSRYEKIENSVQRDLLDLIMKVEGKCHPEERRRSAAPAFDKGTFQLCTRSAQDVKSHSNLFSTISLLFPLTRLSLNSQKTD